LPLTDQKFPEEYPDFTARKLLQFEENTLNRVSSSISHDLKNEKRFIDDLLKPTCDENLDCLFEAMSLCHPGKAQPSSSELSCGRKEDEVILDFCRKCFFVYDKNDMPDNPTQYYFKFKNKKYVYNIVGINEYFEDKRSFSVVFKSPLVENEVQLVCKGEEDYMRDLMNLTKKELEIYDSILRNMHNEGLKTIVYARKTLESVEAQHYYQQIRNLKTSLLSQDEELKKIGKNIENDMELLLILGIRDEMTEGAEEMFQFFHDLRLNVWMTTVYNVLKLNAYKY
jgi:magnesium-transporting ATPase (P-type)